MFHPDTLNIFRYFTIDLRLAICKLDKTIATRCIYTPVKFIFYYIDQRKNLLLFYWDNKNIIEKTSLLDAIFNVVFKRANKI